MIVRVMLTALGGLVGQGLVNFVQILRGSTRRFGWHDKADR